MVCIFQNCWSSACIEAVAGRRLASCVCTCMVRFALGSLMAGAGVPLRSFFGVEICISFGSLLGAVWGPSGARLGAHCGTKTAARKRSENGPRTKILPEGVRAPFLTEKRPPAA